MRHLRGGAKNRSSLPLSLLIEGISGAERAPSDSSCKRATLLSPNLLFMANLKSNHYVITRLAFRKFCETFFAPSRSSCITWQRVEFCCDVVGCEGVLPS